MTERTGRGDQRGTAGRPTGTAGVISTAEPIETARPPKLSEPAEPPEPPESPKSSKPPRPPDPGPRGPLGSEPQGALGSRPPRPSRTLRGPLLSLAVDILLPLLVYYAARALGADQGPALLLSGAPPALRLLTGVVRHRRVDGVDLFLTVLLVAAALVSLIGGGPRVLLFKNAALSLAVGAWALGTAFTRRPLAFQLGQRMHRGEAVRARAGLWQDSAPFRRGQRALTLLWGAEQFLDGGVGALAAATLPPDTVPLLDRAVSLTLLSLAAAVTAGYARRFRIRHALPLFGAPAPATAPRTPRVSSTP
ncbi:VC0807 family protein [Streptomyces eurythermus]|uniref:VC0807 family protein n=1 Tax=Streptomyces sp. DSM 40868 TaxID=2721173 RepID=UPI00244DF21A|nr:MULTISPECIES: VC0807 family protein [Streptomyces]